MASIKLLKSERVIGDVIDDFTPTVKMNIVYDSNTKVTNGFELNPSAVSFPPQVEVEGNIDKFYTLIMTDPDYPGPCEPFWREYLLWMVVDIPGTKSSSSGRELVSYECPWPMIGIHRCVFVLFEQRGREVMEAPSSRYNFSTRQFAESSGMGLPVAAVFFNTRQEAAKRKRSNLQNI